MKNVIFLVFIFAQTLAFSEIGSKDRWNQKAKNLNVDLSENNQSTNKNESEKVCAIPQSKASDKSNNKTSSSTNLNTKTNTQSSNTQSSSTNLNQSKTSSKSSSSTKNANGAKQSSSTNLNTKTNNQSSNKKSSSTDLNTKTNKPSSSKKTSLNQKPTNSTNSQRYSQKTSSPSSSNQIAQNQTAPKSSSFPSYNPSIKYTKTPTCCEKETCESDAYYHPEFTCIRCPASVGFEASYLYMGTYQGGLEFANKIDQNEKNRSKMRFSSGFQVKANFIARWQYEAELNHINLKHSQVASTNAFSVTGMYYPPQAGPLTGANANLNGQLNVWDLRCVVPYQVSKKYTAKPSFAIQGAMLDEDFNVRYFVLDMKYKLKLKNDFWAVGFNAGCESDFYLGQNFSFYGLVNSSLLYTKFKVSENVPNFSIYNYDLKYKNFTKLLPNLKLGLGFSYASMFINNNMKSTIKLGYEIQNWWGVNQLFRPMDTNPVAFKKVARKSLTLNGLVVSLLFDF